jgi:hypothetical protein
MTVERMRNIQNNTYDWLIVRRLINKILPVDSNNSTSRKIWRTVSCWAGCIDYRLNNRSVSARITSSEIIATQPINCYTWRRLKNWFCFIYKKNLLTQLITYRTIKQSRPKWSYYCLISNFSESRGCHRLTIKRCVERDITITRYLCSNHKQK